MVLTTSVHNTALIFIAMRRSGDEEIEAIASLLSSSQTSVEKLIHSAILGCACVVPQFLLQIECHSGHRIGAIRSLAQHMGDGLEEDRGHLIVLRCAGGRRASDGAGKDA